MSFFSLQSFRLRLIISDPIVDHNCKVVYFFGLCVAFLFSDRREFFKPFLTSFGSQPFVEQAGLEWESDRIFSLFIYVHLLKSVHFNASNSVFLILGVFLLQFISFSVTRRR